MNHDFAQHQAFNHNLPMVGCFELGLSAYYYPGD